MDEEEFRSSYVTPTDETVFSLETTDGVRHTFYPVGETEEGVAGRLFSVDPEFDVTDEAEVALPMSRIEATKDFLVRHRKGEITALVSMGTVALSAITIRYLRHRSDD